MQSSATFWDRAAAKYSRAPIRDMDGYNATLNRTRSYLNDTDIALEIGCGTGGTARELAPHLAHITATDISPKMIEIARIRGEEAGITNVRFMALPANATPDGAPFDVVMAHNLLHLVPDANRAVAHVATLVKPGGLFISKSPCLAEPGLSLKIRLMLKLVPLMQKIGKAPYVSYLSSAGLKSMIAKAGFTLVEAGFYPEGALSCYIVARRD